MRLYVDGRPTFQRAGAAHVRLDDGSAHTLSVSFDLARKQLTVTVDDWPTPALHEQLISSVLEQFEGGGGYARVGITAGTGLQEGRPLVLEALNVTAAIAVPHKSVVEPSPAEGYVGRVHHECVFSIRSRTACGLPSLLRASWQVFAQATTSAMAGSVARGAMIPAARRRAPDGSGQAEERATTLELSFVPELAGIHRILVLDSSEGPGAIPYAVGDVLVLQ